MNNERLKKLESVSKKVIWKIIMEETQDLTEEFWIITITDIKISQDLSYLDIFVTSMKNWGLLTKALAKKNYIIQHRYNKMISIRKLPRIRYRYDESWENSTKILETLKNIKNETI